MLSLEPPFWTIDGIVVYRDHAVETQFYYGAPNPLIASVGGRPMLDLFAYTVDLQHSPISGTAIPDQMGAGFLTMGVECRVSDQRRQRLASQLAQKTGIDPARISLYPIPYFKGSVQVIALDKVSRPGAAADPAAADPAQPAAGQPTFVEAILGATAPNLIGDLRTIFSLSLSQDGVSFMEGLYQDGAAPVGVVYDLSYYGLRPLVQARVTADVRTIYESFGGQAGVQYSIFRAGVDATLDHLEQQGVIRVELTSQAVGEEANRARELALSMFKDQIVQQLFRPTTPAPLTGTVAQLVETLDSSAGFEGVSLTLKYKHGEELKTVTYDFSERSPEERRHAPQAFLPLLLTPEQVRSAVHHVDLHNPFFEALDVIVTGPTKEDFAQLGIREVVADLTYGEPGDPVAPVSESLVFRPDSTGDKRFGAARAGRSSLDYAMALTYDLDRSGDIQGDHFRYELAARRETSRAVLINPNADFGLLDLELELGRVPDQLSEVEVQLSYVPPSGDGPAAVQTFRLTVPPAAERPHWKVRTRESEVGAYRVGCTWTFEDKASYQQPAFPSSERLLVIDSPFARTRSLLIRPNVTSAVITEVTVEIEYEDEANGYRRSFLERLAAPFATQTLSWPILDQAAQAIRYRVTTSEPGFVSEGDWQRTSEPSIVVGSAGSRLATIDVRLVGPALAELGIDAVRLDLEVAGDTGDTSGDTSGDTGADAEGGTTSLLLDDTTRSAQARLTYPPGAALAFRYQTTAFKSDGSTSQSAWKDQTSNLLVISTRNL